MKKFPDEKGTSRDKVGETLGLSGPTIEVLAETANAIEQLEAEGKNTEAAEVKAKLKKSASAGHKAAKKAGVVPAKSKRKKSSGVVATSKLDEKGSPEQLAAHERAYEEADRVVTFLRSAWGAQLTAGQRNAWGKILGQIISWMDKLAIKAA